MSVEEYYTLLTFSLLGAGLITTVVLVYLIKREEKKRKSS